MPYSNDICVSCQTGSDFNIRCDSCDSSFCGNCVQMSPQEIKCMGSSHRKLKFVCSTCEENIDLLKSKVAELKRTVDDLNNRRWSEISDSGMEDMCSPVGSVRGSISGKGKDCSSEHKNYQISEDQRIIEALIMNQEYLNLY